MKEKSKEKEELKNKVDKAEGQILVLVAVIIFILVIDLIGVDYFKEEHYCYVEKSEEEIEELVEKRKARKHPMYQEEKKPIIYIYPEKEQEVTIKVSNPERLTTTYPKYNGEWNVIAEPDGTLTDIKSNRKLYSLYWEGNYPIKNDMTEGFCVKGEDTASFLEEKLEILGLNEKEAEEFIIYWLPQMEKNNYNYIYFENIDKINECMSLEITPKPETLIRIMMEFKPIDKPIEVKEQQLNKVERKGYTVVEWGGTEL